MDIIIRNSGGIPIYDQITRQMKGLILRGELKEGEALPSMRLLAKELRISVITTKRAYEELEREGFITTVPGKGCFVAPRNLELVREDTLRRVEEHLSQAVDDRQDRRRHPGRADRDPQPSVWRRRHYEKRIGNQSHLTKDYGSFKLDDVSLTVPGGTIMGLIGENGAGKSTTIKCILNLIRRDGGEIQVLGLDNLADERAVKAQVGVVLDETTFHDGLSAPQVGNILARLYPGWDGALYQHYLEKFGLTSKKLVKDLLQGHEDEAVPRGGLCRTGPGC